MEKLFKNQTNLRARRKNGQTGNKGITKNSSLIYEDDI